MGHGSTNSFLPQPSAPTHVIQEAVADHAAGRPAHDVLHVPQKGNVRVQQLVHVGKDDGHVGAGDGLVGKKKEGCSRTLSEGSYLTLELSSCGLKVLVIMSSTWT